MASWWVYDKKPARAVQGGIKAASGRGAFGESWWGKRWNQVLEGFQIGDRLSRGRSYARRGQVVSIEVEKGAVTARVQGSRPRPYQVSISMKTLSAAEWKKIVAALAGEARFLARLFSGQMPEEIEEVFGQAGVKLFPAQSKDLVTDCSCPDWSNPCKHIAAVYLLLGEVFDKDPFLIFKLRGMEQEELMAAIGPGPPQAVDSPEVGASTREPLLPDPESFWRGGEIPEDLFGGVSLPPVDAVLLKRLGAIPLWRGEQSLLEALGGLYPRAAKRGLDLFLGGDVPAPDTDGTANK